MYTSYHHVVKEIFNKAASLDLDKRAEYLDQTCGQDTELRNYVENLLKVDSANLDTYISSIGNVVSKLDNEATLSCGTQITDMHIQECLASSQMSHVYLAIRKTEEYEQQVIIKTLRNISSHETKHWFTQEKRLQAQLNHPYIAQLIGSGVTDDQIPYIVIEYINGLPINRYCEKYKLGLKQRLQLCIKVCEAVQFAHARLVIHSDIKPSNILITEDGLPKLVDFGIARIVNDVDERTQRNIHNYAFTPNYVSPEILSSSPTTTATDIYSLSVVIYELLFGYQLFKQTDIQINIDGEFSRDNEKCAIDYLKNKRKTAEDIPYSKVPKELVDIIANGLHINANQRYATINALKIDLANYLSGRPIHACSDSIIYRFKKFVGIYRVSIGIALLLMSGTLLSNFFITQQRDRALTAEAAALSELRSSNTVTDYLLNTYRIAAYKSKQFTAREMLDLSSSNLADDHNLTPLNRVKIKYALGRTYEAFGDQEKAEQLFLDALKIYNNNAVDDLDLYIQTVEALAAFHINRREFDQAEQYIQLLDPIILDDNDSLRKAYLIPHIRALNLLISGQHEEAYSEIEKSYQLLDRHADATPIEYLPLNRTKAVYATFVGDDTTALELFRENMENNTKLYGKNSIAYLTSLANITASLINLGEADEAQQYIEDALQIEEFEQYENSQAAQLLRSRLAELSKIQGDFEKSIDIYSALLYEKNTDQIIENPNFYHLNNLAVAYHYSEDLISAKKYFVLSYENIRGTSQDSFFKQTIALNIANISNRLGQYSEAQSIVEEHWNDTELSALDAFQARLANLRLIHAYIGSNQNELATRRFKTLEQYYQDNDITPGIEDPFYEIGAMYYDSISDQSAALDYANKELSTKLAYYDENHYHIKNARNAIRQLELTHKN